MKHLFTLLFVGLMASNIYAQAIFDKKLQAKVSGNTNPVQAIITFEGNAAPTLLNVSLLKSIGIKQGITFKNFPIAGVVATGAQLLKLAENKSVKSIYLNDSVILYNDNSRKLTGVEKLQNDPAITALNKGLPVTGKGIGVVVNDSGIDATHPDLLLLDRTVQNVLGTTNPGAYNQVIRDILGYDTPMDILPNVFLENIPNTDTNSGHGTHVAGTVGGNGMMSGGLYKGVAPGADIIGYGCGGVIFVLDVIGGFDYAISNKAKHNIRIVTNSWGNYGDFDPSHPINLVTKKTYDSGIIVIFAAGNSGPGADTHNPWTAPWVISVAAGDRFGRLAAFSSRGFKGEQYEFDIDGKTWTYVNRPTVTAPGVGVMSARTLSAIGLTGSNPPNAAHIPFYMAISGTSMATPHVAGIVALMLEANPSLTFEEVKSILEETATNMPGYEGWEVGAGYVNAYAAVQKSLDKSLNFASGVNIKRSFNSKFPFDKEQLNVEFELSPIAATKFTQKFQVKPGSSNLIVSLIEGGFRSYLLFTGNTVALSVKNPSGAEVYNSRIGLIPELLGLPIAYINNPAPGEWTMEVNSEEGLVYPETFQGTIMAYYPQNGVGLNDVANHPLESEINLAIMQRLMDGRSTGFEPNQFITREEMADYFLMGQGIRLSLPVNKSSLFSGPKILAYESNTTVGAALRDRTQKNEALFLNYTADDFKPNAFVTRLEAAYSFIQALGQQNRARNANGMSIPTSDLNDIPLNLRGYVKLAIDNGIILPEPDLQNPGSFKFNPNKFITRAEYASFTTKTVPLWRTTFAVEDVVTSVNNKLNTIFSTLKAYPNPAIDFTRLEYTLKDRSEVQIDVVDIHGKTVKSFGLQKLNAGNHVLEISTSDMPNGVYFIRLNANTNQSNMKLIVNH